MPDESPVNPLPRSAAPAERDDELVLLTQKVLDAIAAGDWETYAELCDPAVTCFEPESRGVLVEGLEFHQFYFRGRREVGTGGSMQATMISPRVQRLGADVAVVTYVRLIQTRDAGGGFVASRAEETRVWHRREGGWRLVHLHRSATP